MSRVMVDTSAAPTLDEAATSHFIQAGGVRLHYNEVGSGEPVIMLHGAGPGASSWSNFQQNVPAFAEQFRALLVDMPQFGKSEKLVIEEGRLTFTARALAAFMDELGIARAHFVGNSMGGQAAIKLAIDAPERVGKLVVIGSAPVSQSLFVPTPLEGIKHIAGYYRGDGPSLDKMRRLMEVIVYDQSLVTDAAVRERYEASLDPDVMRIMSSSPPRNEDLSDRLHLVRCPTLVVWGMDDRMGALDVGLLLTRRFQDARMHIFNKCGHWAQVEHADEFNRLVLDFLAH
jgi:4,5:9,10-diseco-3-hydroxy-5,9,17-trioxoandrosta-1(10),2-diene-4-oate hydrolase